MFLLAQLPTEVLKEQLGNGLVLLVLGMGIVFVFLTILVFTTKAVSAIVRKIESKKPAIVKEEVASAAVQSNDCEVAAAILSAVIKARS